MKFFLFCILLFSTCTIINCTFEKIQNTNPLKIIISMNQRIFHVGDDMISPEIVFKNTSENDIQLIGPTATVTYCVLKKPNNTKLRMYIAMPTGRDPVDFPKRTLPKKSQWKIPSGEIYYYVDNNGYRVYTFEEEGTYKITCFYDDIESNTLTIKVNE